NMEFEPRQEWSGYDNFFRSGRRNGHRMGHIEQQSLENHEFHIHQIHFRVLSQNNFERNGSRPDRSIDNQFLDTIQIPFWDGNPKHPFPSVKLRWIFADPILATSSTIAILLNMRTTA